jgi:hypothetical protein
LDSRGRSADVLNINGQGAADFSDSTKLLFGQQPVGRCAEITAAKKYRQWRTTGDIDVTAGGLERST